MSISSNESISSFCGPRTTLYYNATRNSSKALYIFASGINMIISILSTLGNMLVLCAIRKCESLHSSSKALLFSLAMTDLFVGIVVLPLFITYHLTIILEMSNYYCLIAVSYARTSAFISSASLFTIVTISVERYVAFRLRMRYRAVVTFERVVSILGFGVDPCRTVVWLVVFECNSELFFWRGIFDRLLYSNTCMLLLHSSRDSSSCYANTATAKSRTHRNRRQLRFITLQENSSQHDVDIWTFIACYLPFLFALFAILILGLTNSTRFAVHVSLLVVYLNSALNPVLYCWRIKDLRNRIMENCNRICNRLFHLIRLPTQGERTGNTTGSLPRPFQRQGLGNEDV